MPVEYKYLKDKNCVLIDASEFVSLEDVLEYTHSIEQDTQINKPFYEIVNFEKVTNYDFGYHESHEVINRFSVLKETKGYMGSLLVSPTPLTMGVSNMLHVMAEHVGLVMESFEDMQSALDYLSSVAHE